MSEHVREEKQASYPAIACTDSENRGYGFMTRFATCRYEAAGAVSTQIEQQKHDTSELSQGK